jgi:hypothetical protein
VLVSKYACRPDVTVAFESATAISTLNEGKTRVVDSEVAELPFMSVVAAGANSVVTPSEKLRMRAALAGTAKLVTPTNAAHPKAIRRPPKDRNNLRIFSSLR